MPRKVTDQDASPTHGPLVAAVLYDGLCTFEFGIVAEVFGRYRPEMGPDWYRFASCAIEEGPLRALGGFILHPDQGPGLLDEADIIVIPGWKDPHATVPASVCERLVAAHSRGARLVSICSGAYLLAATGLLDGGTATTHWRYAEDLQLRYSGIRVDSTSLYHYHDRIITSAGSAAGIDLMIDIVRQDFGAEAANSVARRLVLPAHRQGGQAQYIERPVPIHQSGQVATLLEKMRETLDRPWKTANMANECRLSLRTFLRRFHEATGSTPGDWLIVERIEAAKTLLQQTSVGIELISAKVGFGSAHALRHHFRLRVGVTPTQYRSRFISANV